MILKILILIMLIIAALMMLLMIGANKLKTNAEKEMEKEEEAKYWKEWEEKKKMRINRGDLYYAELDENAVGSEQAGIRPVVILQNNIGNEYSPTVIVAPITSRINGKAKLPTHVYIKGYKNRLQRNSLILLEQIRVLDKSRLRYYIGELQKFEIKEVEKGLIIALGVNVESLKNENKILKKQKQNIDNKLEIITRNQIVCYGVVAKEYLKHTGNLEITNKQFGDYMLTLMNLYSPEEIEKQAEKYNK